MQQSCLIPYFINQVGFEGENPGFHIERNANKVKENAECESHIYNYVNAGNRRLKAGSTLRLPYLMNYDQSKPKPTIAYIAFENEKKNVESMCGVLPQCPTTTTTTTTTTETAASNSSTTPPGKEKNTTTTTTTTVTTTLEPIEILSGDSCAPFLLRRQESNGNEQGLLKFLVPEDLFDWKLTVSLFQ